MLVSRDFKTFETSLLFYSSEDLFYAPLQWPVWTGDQPGIHVTSIFSFQPKRWT